MKYRTRAYRSVDAVQLVCWEDGAPVFDDSPNWFRQLRDAGIAWEETDKSFDDLSKVKLPIEDDMIWVVSSGLKLVRLDTEEKNDYINPGDWVVKTSGDVFVMENAAFRELFVEG